MKAGYAASDITPEPGLTLSGFAARCNEPSTGVHDPISLHALAIEADEGGLLILAYDLLAIGRPLLGRLNAALDREVGDRFPESSRILCCTHTHSAPAAIKLIGCGIEDDGYWELLVERTRDAAARAVASLEEAAMSYARARLPGRNFNRHIVLRDGRVVMARHPPELVAKSGPGWDEFFFAKFSGAHGPIATFLHWAGHPTTACTQLVSGDYPAALCRRLSKREGHPFFFLQGAAGNVSIPFRGMTFEDTERAVTDLLDGLPPLEWTPLPARPPFALVSRTVELAYRRPPPAAELERTASAMAQIASGGAGDPASVLILSNILNVPPGGAPEPRMLRYIASILERWARETARDKEASRGCELAVKVARFGPIIFVFVAAEVFVETALALAQKYLGSIVEVVGYAAPLVGYLPTDEALEDGGYEAEYAYRFYGHPAPFELGSERKLRAAVESAVTEIRAVADGRTKNVESEPRIP